MDLVNQRRFEVYLAALDPTRGAEMKKTRTCIVVSPDISNDILSTVVVVPVTSSTRGYPTRVRLRLNNRDGEAAIDQIRALDKSRLRRKLGTLDALAAQRIKQKLAEFFS